MTATFAVIGNGVAGVSAVQALRSEGYDGRLFLIGDEAGLPYDRTTLSKAVLAGEKSAPPLLCAVDRYAALDVEVVVGRTVAQLDRARRHLLFADGADLLVDRVLIATGAKARVPQFPGARCAGSAPSARQPTCSRCARAGSQANAWW